MNLFYIPSVICLVCVSLISVPNKGLSMEESEWKNCLYNKESIPCRRTFLCGNAPPPCYSFRLEWKDGLRDSYTRDQTRISQARNVGYYKDPRGGEWQLIGYAGSFFLVNPKNKNTIIYDMTIEDCRKTPWDYLCPN